MRNKEVFYSRKFAKNLRLEKRLQKVLSLFEGHRFRRILDIGCGDGSFSVILKKFSQEVYGVDITRKAIGLAKKRGIKAYQVNVDEEKLPFKSNYFDLIFCGEVIEHLYDPDFLLDEVYRALVPGGIFILTTPNFASWFSRIILLLGFQPYLSEVSLRYNVGKFKSNVPKTEVSGHIRCFTLKALRELLELHNFKIKDLFGVEVDAKISLAVSLLDKILSHKTSLAQYLVFVLEKGEID